MLLKTHKELFILIKLAYGNIHNLGEKLQRILTMKDSKEN